MDTKLLPAVALAVGLLAGCGTTGGNSSDAGLPDAGASCDLGSIEPTELVVGATTYPTQELAQDVLRSDISTQGLSYPVPYGFALDTVLARHRAGEILMPVGFVLRDVVQEPSGDYRTQIANLFEPYLANIDAVIAAGGRVRLQIHCGMPEWLSAHPYPHNVLTGVDEPSDQPVSACSPPTDPAEWSAIIRGVGELFGTRAGHISFSIGSEPENYFVGDLDELLDWYSATARGLLSSSQGASFRLGGLTMVTHKNAELTKTAPRLQGNTVVFTSREYGEPITKTWIQRCAAEGLPVDLVTLHQFGGSPVPAVGTFWRRARLDISAWLQQSGYAPEQVEVAIEDWPQWVPFTSNDTQYYAAHMASGIISMSDLSLSGGTPVRPVQAFLFDFGYRREGAHPAGFAGRVGMLTEFGITKPVFNVNSLLAELEGTVTPVQSSTPFVHAIAAVSSERTTLLIANQIPLEYQKDVYYDYWEQTPILANYFVGEDLSGIAYNKAELIDVFFDGVMPSWPELLDAFFADPSPIDLDLLSWPDEIKAAWEEARRIGRLARSRRVCHATARILFATQPAGRYRFEHFVLDSQHANTYTDREIIDQRLRAAQASGQDALLQEIRSINQEYDAESGQVDDREIQLEDPRAPVDIDMEPNSVHLVRLTALP